MQFILTDKIKQQMAEKKFNNIIISSKMKTC